MKHYLILLLLLAPIASPAKTWLVGPTRQYTVPSAVASLVSNGDTVLVDSGSYTGDVSVWNASNLVLRCPNGMARFNANGNIAQKKGIFVIYGDSDYMEGFELYGAAISEADGDNGAGIRMQGHGFTCRRCYIHDNQDGILSGIGSDTTGDILIEACEFYHNGVESGPDAGYEHNIYIGHCASLTIKFCYFHGSVQGHELKTRATRNYILYNKIVDGQTGDGSFSIDIPNGGLACVVGNAIEKGPMNVNRTCTIDYGGEGIINGDSEFYFINNTVVTDRAGTTLFHLQPGARALIANNIFTGTIAGFANSNAPTPDTVANVISQDTAFFHFRNVMIYDYHPVADFPGLGSALPLKINGVSLVAENEYVDPLDSAARPWESEIGAFNEIGNNAVQHNLPVESIATNYPNPFSTETVISGALGYLELFDARGNRQEVSYHQNQNGLVIERGSLPAGIYFYSVSQGLRGTIEQGSVVIRP
ncbi:MAG TPA: T9SS type A sorting domain-containing protein [Candidatus Kapabacteria bacterium]|nr:T9SS type A sorting domain-containing protein [Candidatus Kapabacteria bacterium]